MKYFEQHHLEEIRQRADIVTLIQRYLPLHKRGNRYVGLCPFHDDRSPSMNVTPSMGLYKCFACGAGGDVFKFLMEHEKLSFPEAVISVAEMVGYALPEREVHQHHGAVQQGFSLLETLEFAKNFFVSKLNQHPDVIKYLSNRGLGAELCREFQVGFAPAEWDSLVNSALKQGYTRQNLLDAGLIIEKDDDRAYDRYRNRVIIPIYNLSTKVVAFGGRTLDLKENAKYINSPETSLYKKSEILFGLSHSKKHIVDSHEFYVVEGYMDFLQMWQHGLQNSVAVSGTALTPQHVQILKRFSRRAVLLFDGDQAGKKASRRSIPLLLFAGIEVLVLDFPDGEDPDSYLHKNGAEAFLKHRKSAISWVDWMCRDLPRDASPEAKADLSRDVREFLAQISDPIIRQGYAKRAGQILEIDAKWLQRPNSNSNSNPYPVRAAQGSPNHPQAPVPLTKRNLLDSKLVVWILRHPFLLPMAVKQLPLNLIRDDLWLEILDLAFFLDESGQYNPKTLYDRLGPDAKRYLEQSDLDSHVDKELALREYLQILTRLMLDDVEGRLARIPKDSVIYQELTRWDEQSKRSQLQNLRELQKLVFPAQRLDHEKFALFLKSYGEFTQALSEMG